MKDFADYYSLLAISSCSNKLISPDYERSVIYETCNRDRWFNWLFVWWLV